MGIRTVRLDEEAEKTLARLRRLTGLSISEVLKRGLIAYKTEAIKNSTPTPYEVYRQLELGDGRYALAPAKQAKSAVKEIIRRKHAR